VATQNSERGGGSARRQGKGGNEKRDLVNEKEGKKCKKQALTGFGTGGRETSYQGEQ